MTPEVAPLWPCPFCGDCTGTPASCGGCRRDKRAPRRSCPACRKFTPMAEPACCHCRQTFTSELAWKVPVIVLMFVAALVVAVLVRTL